MQFSTGEFHILIKDYQKYICAKNQVHVASEGRPFLNFSQIISLVEPLVKFLKPFRGQKGRGSNQFSGKISRRQIIDQNILIEVTEHQGLKWGQIFGCGVFSPLIK